MSQDGWLTRAIGVIGVSVQGSHLETPSLT
jgi:hypothetical protein